MKFDILVESILRLEGPKYGSKYGDWRDYDKRYYQDGQDTSQTEPKTVIGTDLKGPIIINGYVQAEKLKKVEMEQKFKTEFEKGTPDSQKLFKNRMREWYTGKPVMKLDPPKHSLIGGGRIWDVSHAQPSIKVRLDIDGVNRVLTFRNIWWDYNLYLRQYTA